MHARISITKIVGAAILLVAMFSNPARSMTVESQKVGKFGAVTKVKMEVEVPRVIGGSGKAAELDILFVVDDSGSMSTHQANLLKNADGLVRAALDSGVDVHAGVINTNVDAQPWGTHVGTSWKGELAGVTKKYAATADGDFATILNENLKVAMDTNGSGEEQPFEAIQLAFSEPNLSSKNKGFLREHAALAIFVLTDADDQSKMPVANFVAFLKTLKGSAPVTMHAAYIPVGDKTCDRAGEPEPQRIEQALKAFGTQKESVSLCDSDFGSKLAAIGEGYEMAGLDIVQLKLAPIVSTIKVGYGTEILTAGDLAYGWTYDHEKMQIRFGEKINWFSQPEGTSLTILYQAK